MLKIQGEITTFNDTQRRDAEVNVSRLKRFQVRAYDNRQF